jgi:hypothetical protein
MPYIGKSPVGGGFHKLDALTASATATYALTLGGAAYYPETANQLLVSLNGIIQAPQDSFQVSGSNLIFDSALTASDSIDFVVALGDVLGVGSVTDGAITTAKIGNNAVTSAKLATTIAPTNLETTASTFKMTDLTTDAFYRTGTFTPFWTSENVTTQYESNLFTDASYAVQKGDYVRIGNMVHATIFLKLDHSAAGYANSGSHSQALGVNGLPFKVKNVAQYFPMTSSVFFDVDTDQGWSSYNLVGYGNPDKKYVLIFFPSAGGTTSSFKSGHIYGLPTGQSVPASSNARDSEMMFQLTYETDEA